MRLEARSGYFSEFRETTRDFVAAFNKFPLAASLAGQDILARYRGSVLGPWWITITMGALVLGIGISYSELFHVAVRELLPYVAMGLVFWGFISSNISEGGEAFVAGGAILRQSALPLPLFVIRCMLRNLINLAHHMVIVVGVLLWFQIFPGIGILWSLVGLLVVVVNLTWLSLALAMVSARFRDVPQIVTAVLQFIFFLSPIFWQPSGGLVRSPLVTKNPFYFGVQLVREPLLKGTIHFEYLSALLSLGAVGWVATLMLYNQTRRRVVHYL